jgi:hypothetical protein
MIVGMAAPSPWAGLGDHGEMGERIMRAAFERVEQARRAR